MIIFCSYTLDSYTLHPERQTFPWNYQVIANANFCVVNFDSLKIALYFPEVLVFLMTLQLCIDFITLQLFGSFPHVLLILLNWDNI